MGLNLCVLSSLTTAAFLSSSPPGGCGTTFTTQLNILLNTDFIKNADVDDNTL